MRQLSEDDIRGAFANASDDELRLLTFPPDLVLTDWDHLDFLAWRDQHSKGRGYLVAELGNRPIGVVLRSSEGSSRASSALCNVCHTMQPADQVSLFSARKAGDAGLRGDTVGTYLCTDLSCHENVRLAAPLAPNEVRASVDARIDGTRQRAEAFIERVLESARAEA
ncbi:FBP C-terminal treble-clef zinc-finger [Microbacterium sp. cf046]|uniref:FBP domain-containing protein n=1 Tax=Microbacterium sp. cf046 TaxID=1761803 RepID=UPI0008E73BB3|nr:FBP domain-containing protein [Microbacterium sp. cf046]SFS15579.1 FBP C-terminal treble-clef zinc-finger [Microbacterium sp. cf046]